MPDNGPFASGKAWERACERVLKLYVAQNRCAYIKQDPPWVKKGGTVRETGPGPADFGVLSGLHGSFQIECKSVQADRWGFGLLELHQANHLEAWEGQGAHSLILMHMAKGNWSFAIEWGQIGPMWWAWYMAKSQGLRAAHGCASLGVDAATAAAFSVGHGGIDWLNDWGKIACQ